jgi:formylglycine-generating enzyme required for sulfatase activity
MTSPLVQQYVDEAVRFAPDRARLHDGRPIRVARNLLTCRVAVDILNELGVPSESETSYRYINVHNPRCPLSFDESGPGWGCADAIAEHPVWGINWAGAVLMCSHLGARLPRVGEWECMASNNDPARIYPWGDAVPDHTLANYDEHYGGTSPVGRFAPSDLGLYDLAGNLSEWCADHPSGPGSSFERVVKGGAWSKHAGYLAIDSSRGKWERLGTTTIGLRPVWDDGVLT